MKLSLIRYTKILFTYLQLHQFFGLFKSLYHNLYYITLLSKWAHENRKVPYNDFPSKWNYEKRYGLYEWVVKHESLTEQVNYMEFGVASGQSFKWFLQRNQNPESRFYGFDTFDGLPEDWGPYKKGSFSNNNSVPKINDVRGKFYQGLFQKTLPEFLKNFKNENRNVIMMDADLHSATLYVLCSLAPYLKLNDIIFFDEFAVPTHEFKAFVDFTQSYYMNIQLIAAANNYYFAAFRVM